MGTLQGFGEAVLRYVVPPFIALVYGIISCSSAAAIWRGGKQDEHI